LNTQTKFLLLILAVSIVLGFIISYLSYHSVEIDILSVSATLVFFALAFMFCWISYKYTQTVLSPIILMTIAWTPIIFLHDLQLSPAFLQKLSLQTWSVIIYTYVSFCIGCLVWLKRTRRKTNGVSGDISKLAGITNRFHLTLVLYIFFGIGLLLFVYNVIMRGGVYSLPFFAGVSSKWTFLLPIIGQFFLLMEVSSIWSFLYISVYGIKRSIIPILMIIIMIAANFLLTFRSNIFSVIITGNVLLLLVNRRRRISPSQIAFTVLMMFLIFQAIVSISGQNERIEFLVNSGQVTTPYIFVYPYMYLTSSITNLQLNMQTQIFTGGTRTFGALLSILQITQISALPDYISLWGGGIVPYQGTLFLDFGYWGIIFGPFILGLLSGLSFGRFTRYSGWLDAVLYSVIASSILTSAITNWFVLGRTWLYVITSIAMHLVLLAFRTSSKSRFANREGLEKEN